MNIVNYAKFLQQIRGFFANNNILEVNTNALLNTPTLDSNIDNIMLSANKKYQIKNYFLHSSPELAMKVLLSKNSGSIYQICKVFRDNEVGKLNFNEFTMLEYYLVNVNMLGLIENVLRLFKHLKIGDNVVKFSYFNACKNLANINLDCELKELKELANSHNLSSDFDNIADLQIFLWTHFVETKFKNFEICVIYDYPKSQAALAKIQNNVAKRFEIYVRGIEVANGYYELQTADEYRQRFLTNSGNCDNEFLQNITTSLPQCSGVAIGLDRLFMLQQ